MHDTIVIIYHTQSAHMVVSQSHPFFICCGCDDSAILDKVMTQNEPWTSSCISAKLELCIYHGSQNSILIKLIITFTASESVPTKLEIINEVYACMPKTGTVALVDMNTYVVLYIRQSEC